MKTWRNHTFARARIERCPRDYRSLGVMLDSAWKPPGRRLWDLTISLWWWDISFEPRNA